MAVLRPRLRGKRVVGVLVQALARREMPRRDLRPFVRGPEPRRGVARGLLVEALVGGLLFLLWQNPLSVWAHRHLSLS